MYVCVYLQSNTLPTELPIVSVFLLRITQLEQCDSSPFVSFYRKMQAIASSSHRNRSPLSIDCNVYTCVCIYVYMYICIYVYMYECMNEYNKTTTKRNPNKNNKQINQIK